MSSMPRSVYLARLRRAFLLRVHPDRFRNHSATVRNNQANLVKALADRMSQTDFLHWQQLGGRDANSNAVSSISSLSFNNASQNLSYVVERRDGSLLRASLRLGDSVDTILASMAQVLKSSGAASLPTPPKEQLQPQPHVQTDFRQTSSAQNFYNQGQGVDPRFNVVSNRGRDFASFLSTLDAADADADADGNNTNNTNNNNDNSVEYRRACRMDAVAAALEARRVYQFQAIDATSLGWSSSSVAMLLRQLRALHEEHNDKFHVSSFYPVRLLFTPDDFHETLDVYAGTLRLQPASTPIQWLESLQLVTLEKVKEIQHKRKSVMDMTKLVQGALGLKVKKGFSCSSREYYHFLKSICPTVTDDDTDDKDTNDDDSMPANSLVLEPIVATVEGSEACRRPIVTKEGSIRLGAGMDSFTVVQAVTRLMGPARLQLAQQKVQLDREKDAVHQAKWQFGLQKVYRTGIVSHDEFVQCLVRILSTQQSVKSNSNSNSSEHDNNGSDSNASYVAREVKRRLTGNSLGIAGSGHFCHLADDGSVVIPHDWR